MYMDILQYQYFLAGIIIFCCSYIQTVAGFSYALFAVPLLMLIGFDLPAAVILSFPGSFITRLLVVHHCREHIEWKPLWAMLPFCLGGLVIGISGLKHLSSLPPESVRQYVGTLILLTVCMRSCVKIKPRDSIPLFWGFLAAFFSGILGGVANIGGPPLVLWLVAHKWSVARTRSLIPAFTLMMIPLQLSLLWIVFGSKMLLLNISIGSIFLPLIILAAFIGNYSSQKLSADKLRTIIFILLIIIGVSYLVYPFLKNITF